MVGNVDNGGSTYVALIVVVDNADKCDRTR